MWPVSCRRWLWSSSAPPGGRTPPVRALTLTAQALVEEGEAGEQLDLFAAGAAPRRDKLEKLEKAMDGIRDKFGRDAIAPASTVHRDRAEVKAEQRLPPVD